MRLVAGFLLSLAVLAPTPLLAQSERYCETTLIGKTPGSRINLRSGAGTDYPDKGYGLVGDVVQVLPDPASDSRDYLKALDSQGSLWYGIRVPESGAQGWVRQDFVSSIECYGE